MSPTSPIPALRGPDGTGARVDGRTLLVRQVMEEMQVYLEAVARLRAEGRTLAVELTAEAGAVPAVYRYEGADEASVAAFADAVNALLPETPARVDGTQYMAGVRLGRDLQERRLHRVLRRSSLYGACVVVAATVAAGFVMPAAATAGVAVFATLGMLVLVGCAAALYGPYREAYLRRHGVRVTAERVPGESRYAYRDASGLERVVRGSGEAWTLDVLYDPRDSGRVLVPRSLGRRLPGLVGIGAAALLGLAFLALPVAALVEALLGLDGA
ncbi:hypothetical protein AB0G79_07690 [Streptomyces sp. NPDC020807]|uniref:hypothetical protein n=1 Tax=Streptomyces sp. NPDC020807 TaxID=3155119 RepID=UPI0033C85603